SLLSAKKSPAFDSENKLVLQTDHSASKNNSPFAVCIVEVEIDTVDYTPEISGIWIIIHSGTTDEDSKRHILARSLSGALGWTLSENIIYFESNIFKNKNSSFYLKDAIDMKNVQIGFSGDDDETDKNINYEEIPYIVFPSAFVQAVSQAVGHHFFSIPTLPWNVWDALKKRQETEKG
ncbi:MAG: hypothetical protein LBV52_05150, partial [Spirochaetaceae bacterium]|nr:hypothetical protein [Spirochaetaceae bacterium]